jgi:hypothetical protein
MQCEIRRFEGVFPQNFFYDKGRMFCVTLLSVSISSYTHANRLVLPRLIERISAPRDPLWIDGFNSVQYIAFESGSKLTRIESRALSECSSLESICLPAAVDFMGEGAFYACKSLSSFTFESGSKLTRIESKALSGCSSLESICLPSSVEFLGESSFYGCQSLRSFTFESGSNLTQIEAKAFDGCSSLKSILISRCIQELRKDWAVGSSLREVTFESALSLRMLIESRKVDLRQNFALIFVARDCLLNFPGYYLRSARCPKEAFRLRKYRSRRR